MSHPTNEGGSLYWKSTRPLEKSKPAIVFIHAAWMSSEMWDETIQDIVSGGLDMNLIQIDLNGHGQTTRGRTSFTLWDQAQDILQLLVQYLKSLE
jgi:pimeloyl-ACP methyl ester carboxylesterase